MTHYSHHWTCERCGRAEESVDWPRTLVCERCVGAGLVVVRHTESSQAPLLRIAEDAYLRGYRHGKKVATEDAMPAVLAAAAPHLIDDEMVERAARALHEVSDDVLPFDLHITEDMGRRDERARQNRIDQRRERHLSEARAALEAALGGQA